ncbi:hypothetical protein [Paenibacillus typhae]|uniref:hypothetical protein n=1 Tax=Paenibacillus typhae TaxID=1174501 RepID=UPI001C8D6A88|nr:hypothetical protein [Paenibacillus typhae]MBY0010286.1 hypothetical protein [Paenibacillus typhae]
MKIIGIYMVLALLTLGMIVSVDMIAGTSLPRSLQSVNSVFATTSLQEACCMIVFAGLPVFFAAGDLFTPRKSTRK